MIEGARSGENAEPAESAAAGLWRALRRERTIRSFPRLAALARFSTLPPLYVLAIAVLRPDLSGLELALLGTAVVVATVVEYRLLKHALGVHYLASALLFLALVLEKGWLARYGLIHTAWWFVPAFALGYLFVVRPLARFVARRPRLFFPIVWPTRVLFALAGPRRAVVVPLVLGYGLFLVASVETFKWGLPIRSCATPAKGVRYLLLSSCHVRNWEQTYASIPGAPRNPGATSRDTFRDGRGRMIHVAGWSDEPRADLSPIVWLDESGAFTKAVWARGPFAGVCQDGSGRCVVISPVSNSVIVLDEERQDVVESIRLDYSPDLLDVDEQGRIVVMLIPPATNPGHAVPDRPERDVRVPGGGAALVKLTLDLRDGSLGFQPLSGAPGHGYFARVLPGGDVVTGFTPLVASAERPSSKLSAGWLWTLWTGDVAAGAAVRRDPDPARVRIWVAYTFGDILELDSELRRLRTIPVPLGSRGLEYDARRDLLFCAGYDDGYVTALDATSGAMLARWDVGSQIRRVRLHGDELLVTSGAGGITSIDLNDALPARAAPADP